MIVNVDGFVDAIIEKINNKFRTKIQQLNVTKGGVQYYLGLTLDYSLSMDQHNLSRAVYTYFDVLGNVGGLSGVLFSVAAFLNGMFTFNHSDNVLV